MSGHAYAAVAWNPQKRRYDLVMLGGVVLYLVLFSGLNFLVHPTATVETTIIRAFGTCAFLLLHVVLSIGPLCRLDHRFLPLLYNRRHLGVTTFLVGLVHAALATFQFHALGVLHPFASILRSNPRYDSVAQFPFETLGVAALVILFLMAATSHDFWLANLSAPVWKALHMLVYGAYALLVLHVALGALQSERSHALTTIVGVGLAWIVGIHVAAARRERTIDRGTPPLRFDDIPESRARIVCVGGERIAVFRYEGKVAALSNVCAHQGGPLGEGRIIDGCVTCPWHGYQYLPETGAAPPPFTERVARYDARVADGIVHVDPRPRS